MKVDEKQKNRSKTGQPETIPSDLSCQKNRNLGFVTMKSFFKSEFLTINLSKVNF
jgi:hypothetical protein